MWSQEISREDWACLWGVQAEALTKLCGSTYIDPTTYSADLHVQPSKFTVCVQNKYCVQFCSVWIVNMELEGREVQLSI